MTPLIGYYVHHHGDGHRQRALALASQPASRMVLLGTHLAGRCGDARVVELADDRPHERFDAGDVAAGRLAPLPDDALHYAPLHHQGVRARAAQIAGWIAAERPALMVVDVSVEVAMLARLCATPVVYVRLAGRREDAPHVQAFHGATALLAPFARGLDDPALPAWIRRKTHYCPGIGPPRPPAAGAAGTVLVVYGKGGAGGDGDAIAAAARATPARQWRCIGPVSPPADPPANLAVLGWVEDAMAEIASAGIVIGGAGDGLVSAVLAARGRLVCIPEARPFNEQCAKAERLAALGAARVLPAWPEAGLWPDILAAAEQIDLNVLAGLDDPDGVTSTVALLNQLAL